MTSSQQLLDAKHSKVKQKQKKKQTKHILTQNIRELCGTPCHKML